MDDTLYKLYGKRGLDLVFSLMLILLLSPLLLLTYIVVRKQMGPPAIYKVERPGKEGEIFTLYKFRSMTNEKGENGKLLPDAERLTLVGKLLRKTSIDELPELFNILKGDMSFVGPRPLSIKYLPYYTPEEMRRHEVLPGLTGLAQVSGRNRLTWEERFKLDLKYVNNLSFILDFYILLKTIKVTLKSEDVTVRGSGQLRDFHKERREAFENKQI